MGPPPVIREGGQDLPGPHVSTPHWFFLHIILNTTVHFNRLNGTAYTKPFINQHTKEPKFLQKFQERKVFFCNGTEIFLLQEVRRSETVFGLKETTSVDVSFFT